MPRVAVLALSAALAQYPLAPQSDVRPAVVIGQVVDIETGRALPNAIVQMAGEGAAQKAAADERGRFFFIGLAPGAYTITASKHGFFDGSFGRVRPGGANLQLPLYSGQWLTGLEIGLFPPAVISGVVDDEAGEPLVGVPVQALRRETSGGRVRLVPAGLVRTDDNGLYRLHDLMPGEYVVSVPSVQASVPIAALEEVGRTGSSTADLSVVLFMNGVLDISGRELGQGLFLDDAGEHVMLLNRAATPPDGAAYPTMYYPAADRPDYAVPIVVGPGETRAGVSFRLQPVAVSRVEGVARGPDGPVGGQLLRLRHAGADDFGIGAEVAATVTAPDGTFTLINVPAGRYVLDARSGRSAHLASPHFEPFPDSPAARGRASAPPPSPLSGRDQLWGRIGVTVHDEDVKDLVIDMEPGVTIAGVVGFWGQEPIPEADLAAMAVTLTSASGDHSGVPPAPVDADGGFAIAGVVPGRYRIAVESPPAGWSLESATVNGRNVSDDWLDLAAGEDVANAVIRLTDQPTTLAGSVYDARGVPLPGTRVIAFPFERLRPADGPVSPQRFGAVRADVYGWYSLEGLLPGDYLVTGVDAAVDRDWRDPEVLDELRRGAARVSLQAGASARQDLRVVR